MRIDRRLVLIGVMIVVLSMTMATQYATTKIGYSYNIVHPSDADIRFIGSDNSSDGIRILRVDGTNGSTNQNLKIELGNISANVNKSFTAAFGIVNEENFNVTISHINVSATNGSDYMQIWLHGDRDKLAENDESSVMVWDKGDDKGLNATSSAWGLAVGDQDSTSMNGGVISTPWDYTDTSHVRYSIDDSTNAENNTHDFVWVQISLDAPADADSSAAFDGVIFVHTRASTHDS